MARPYIIRDMGGIMKPFIYALAVICGIALGLGAGAVAVRSGVLAPAANATINFSCCSYTPANVTINAGETVTWLGSFQFHPLAEVPDGVSTTPGGPGGFGSSSGTSYQFTFANPGTYYYICSIHGGFGMRGEVHVLAPVLARAYVPATFRGAPAGW